MKLWRKTILPVFLAAIWISGSEFVRNELLVKSYWLGHYKKLGLVFPSAPINAAVWGVWSFLFAIAVYLISRKFSLMETALLSWLVGFVLMWVVVGNLGVLPYGMLPAAVPLSLLESLIAAVIVKKL